MSRRERTAILGVLFAGVLMGALDIAIVGPALPAIRETFGVDARALSWVFSVYILFYLLGAPLLAKLSDRHGRRTVYVAGLALFAIGSLCVALAPAFGLLLAGRALQAFGAGGMFPIASAVIADTFPIERRGRALGMIGAVFGVAFLVGPLLGGLLLRWSWQWLFLINLPIASIVIAGGLCVLPRSGPRPAEPFDASGAAVLGVMLVALIWGLSHIDPSAVLASLGSLNVLPCLVVVLVAAPVYWIVEQRAADPVLHPDLFRSAQLSLIVAIALATGSVEAGMVFLPEIAVIALHVQPATASFMMLPLVLALIVGAPAAGQSLDRFGARPVIQVGLALTVTGLVLLAVPPLTSAGFYAGGACVGFGLAGLLGAPLRYITLREAGESRRGAGQALLTLSLGIGRLVGAAVIGGVAASGASTLEGYRDALFSVAVACAAALLLSFALASTAPSPATSGRSETGRASS